MDLQVSAFKKPGARLCRSLSSSPPRSTINDNSPARRRLGFAYTSPTVQGARHSAGNLTRHLEAQPPINLAGNLDGGMGSAAPSRLRVHNVGNHRALWEKGHDHAGSPLVT